MTKIPMVLVPIEPLTERYSEQWYRRFPVEFSKEGFDVKVIDGEVLLDNEIKVGTFLDINSTLNYKFSQLQKIARMFNAGEVEPNTVFFFSDIEFWGLESVRLMADMNGVPIKMAGFLHAASYTKGDAFAVAAQYQRFTEVGWVAALDMVFVGSHYHKEAFLERRLTPVRMRHQAKKIVVSSNPLFADEYPEFPDVKKENMVVLTNRFDEEKAPGETLALFAQAKAKHPDWRFVVCTSRPHLRSNNPDLVAYARRLESEGVIEIHDGLTKNEYHQFLAKARIMVSHSLEENFGYCIVEAIQYGCMPYLRRGLSHTELVGANRNFLFDSSETTDEQLVGLEHLMHNHMGIGDSLIVDAPRLLRDSYSALTFMANHLGAL